MACVFWIDGNPPPPLAIVLCPRGGSALGNELRDFKREGIQTLVSLLSLDQVEILDLEDEGPMAKRFGMSFLSLPLPDHSIPPDESAFRAFVAALARRLTAGERIGVHCWGSIGRATITAACTLVHLGWHSKAALNAIELARCCPVPDTEEQRRWILSYKP
jgi:protein-tyrosine phosphatase